MAVQNCSGNVSMNFNFNEVATLVFSTTGVYPAQPLTQNGFAFANATAGALNCDTIHAKQYTLASTTSARSVRWRHAALAFRSGMRVRSSQAVCSRASQHDGWLPDEALRLSQQCSALVATGGELPVGHTERRCLRSVRPQRNHHRAWKPIISLIRPIAPAITLDSASNTVIANLLIVGNSSAS